MKNWANIILTLSLLVGCVVDESEGGEAGSTDFIKLDDSLPAFSVEVTDGDVHSVFSSWQISGPTVIVFFNTGCSDCQRELPRLNDYYLAHRFDDGFRMVAIAREESEESIVAFWQLKGLSIPYSPQPDRRIYNLFASLTIPRVYFCSHEGIVTWIGVEKFTLPEG